MGKARKTVGARNYRLNLSARKLKQLIFARNAVTRLRGPVTQFVRNAVTEVA